jgi:hypothetical protein
MLQTFEDPGDEQIVPKTEQQKIAEFDAEPSPAQSGGKWRERCRKLADDISALILTDEMAEHPRTVFYALAECVRRYADRHGKISDHERWEKMDDAAGLLESAPDGIVDTEEN